MSNRKLTPEELKQKMMFLAGTSNINESVAKTTNKNSKLLYHKKLADGRVYGIIQECQHYFVKVNSNPTENISVNDFAFIGGVNNALHEKFNSYFDAKNRINGKSISLNEAYGTYNVLNEDVCEKCEEEEEVLDEEIEKTPESSEKEEVLDENIPLNKDIDAKKVEAPVETPSEVPVEAPSEAPVEVPVETPVEAPVETPSEDAPMVDATDLKDYNPESGESTPSVTPSLDSEDGEDSGDTVNDIQSLIGKLTQKLSTIDTVEPSLAKTTLNSVISATKSGIAQFTDKEKEDFKKRIDTGGEKLDEEIANLMESNFGKRLLKKLIKEEVDILKKKSNLNESDDKVIVKGGYYKFNPSTKTFQTTLVNKEGEPYPGEEFNKEEEAVSFLSASSLNENEDSDDVLKAEKSIELLKNKKDSSDVNQYYKTALNNIKVFRDSKPEEFKKLLAVINKIIYSKNESINESAVNNDYTHFAVRKSDNKIVSGWEYKNLDNESIKEYSKIDLKDNFPNNKLSDFKIVTKKSLENNNVNPFDTNNWYKIEELTEEEVQSVPNIRKHIKVTFDNGDTLNTEINGSEDEIKKYYIGKQFNLGIGPKDNMVKATNVEFLQ
jgi:hypothetical protein